MPNTPLAAGAGMTAICCDEAVTEPMKQTAAAIFSSCGEIEFVDEKALQAITAISGCGPGYCFVIIDALADAGVRAGSAACAGYQAGCTDNGRQRQAVRRKRPASGTAARPGNKPRRHDYCRASHALENHGVRGAFYDAVQAVLQRDKELQGK